MNAFACTEIVKDKTSSQNHRSKDKFRPQEVPSPSSPLSNIVGVPTSIRSPNVVNRKGRPNSSRLNSRCEVIGKRKKKAHPTTVETTPVDVTSPDVNVGNQNQFNIAMSSYNPTQPVRLPFICHYLVCFNLA